MSLPRFFGTAQHKEETSSFHVGISGTRPSVTHSTEHVKAGRTLPTSTYNSGFSPSLEDSKATLDAVSLELPGLIDVAEKEAGQREGLGAAAIRLLLTLRVRHRGGGSAGPEAEVGDALKATAPPQRLLAAAPRTAPSRKRRADPNRGMN